MMKSKMGRLVFVISFIFLIVFSAEAQKAKYQSIFIYNFSRYIKWPEHIKSDYFTIGVIGDGELLESLQSLAQTKGETQGLKIVVDQYKSVSEIKQCHILFVEDEFCGNIDAIKAKTKQYSSLLVTDKPGMAEKGSVINFVEQNGKIRFELNRTEAEALGLKISGSLSNLATIIE